MHNVSKSKGVLYFLASWSCHNPFRTHNTIPLRTHTSCGHTHSSSEPASHTCKVLRWHLAMHPTGIQSVSVRLGLLYIVCRYSPSARGRNRWSRFSICNRSRWRTIWSLSLAESPIRAIASVVADLTCFTFGIWAPSKVGGRFVDFLVEQLIVSLQLISWRNVRHTSQKLLLRNNFWCRYIGAVLCS